MPVQTVLIQMRTLHALVHKSLQKNLLAASVYSSALSLTVKQADSAFQLGPCVTCPRKFSVDYYLLQHHRVIFGSYLFVDFIFISVNIKVNLLDLFCLGWLCFVVCGGQYCVGEKHAYATHVEVRRQS